MFKAIEAKMFTSPINDELRILRRLQSHVLLEKYLVSRKCFYFLIGFSFLYKNSFFDENPQKVKDFIYVY